MTNVNIAYNPFTTKTDILVNNESVQSTSTLYRYRNTPMQDWVGSFLPDLMEHCNDDEIHIVFRGLKFNFDDLVDEVNQFKSKNRDIDITLKDEICKSQVARIGALQSIIDDIQTQELVPELKADDVIAKIADSFTAILEVITVSSHDELKNTVLNALVEHDIMGKTTERGIRIIDSDKAKEVKQISDEGGFDIFECPISFTNSKYSTLNIVDTLHTDTQADCYYRYIKKAITSADKPIILVILGANASDDNAELLDLMAVQYKNKGRQNKERFIFVAENTEAAKKYLYNDYAIKNMQIFGADDILSMQDIIKKYMEEYCLVEKIKSFCVATGNVFSALKNNLEDSANRNKSTQEVESKRNDALDTLKLFLTKTVDSITNINNFEIDHGECVQQFLEQLYAKYTSLLNELETKRCRERIIGNYYVGVKKEDFQRLIANYKNNSFQDDCRNTFYNVITAQQPSLHFEDLKSNDLLSENIYRQISDALNKHKRIERSLMQLIDNQIAVYNHGNYELYFDFAFLAAEKYLSGFKKSNEQYCFIFKSLFEAIAAAFINLSLAGWFSEDPADIDYLKEKGPAEIFEKIHPEIRPEIHSVGYGREAKPNKNYKLWTAIIEDLKQITIKYSDMYYESNNSLLAEIQKVISEGIKEVEKNCLSLKEQAKISAHDQECLNYIDTLAEKLSKAMQL